MESMLPEATHLPLLEEDMQRVKELCWLGIGCLQMAWLRTA